MTRSLRQCPSSEQSAGATLALDVWRLGLGSVAALWLLNDLLPPERPAHQAHDSRLIFALPVGLMLGFWIELRQEHPTRRLCFVPIGALGLTAGLALWLAGGVGWAATLMLSLSAGLLMVPRRRPAESLAAAKHARRSRNWLRILAAAGCQGAMFG